MRISFTSRNDVHIEVFSIPPPSLHISIHLLYIANHHAIFKNVGITPVDYPYYHPATIGLDYEGFLGALHNAIPRSVFLLHACAHNPTGVDPTKEQWATIADVMLEKGHFAFFDCAYQGFASGDLDRDAFAVRNMPFFLHGAHVGFMHGSFYDSMML